MTHEEDDNSHRVLTLIDDRVTLDPLFPLHAKDYWGFFLAILGLVVAAGGVSLTCACVLVGMVTFFLR